jgi:hypothetical protein
MKWNELAAAAPATVMSEPDEVRADRAEQREIEEGAGEPPGRHDLADAFAREREGGDRCAGGEVLHGVADEQAALRGEALPSRQWRRTATDLPHSRPDHEPSIASGF